MLMDMTYHTMLANTLRRVQYIPETCLNGEGSDWQVIETYAFPAVAVPEGIVYARDNGGVVTTVLSAKFRSECHMCRSFDDDQD